MWHLQIFILYFYKEIDEEFKKERKAQQSVMVSNKDAAYALGSTSCPGARPQSLHIFLAKPGPSISTIDNPADRVGDVVKSDKNLRQKKNIRIQAK